MVMVCIWLALAVVGGLIASSKGISGWQGALWGGLLDLIGIVIVVCLPSRLTAELD